MSNIRTVSHNGRTYTGEFWEEWLEWEKMVDYADSANAERMGMNPSQYQEWKSAHSKDRARNPLPLLFSGHDDKGRECYRPQSDSMSVSELSGHDIYTCPYCGERMGAPAGGHIAGVFGECATCKSIIGIAPDSAGDLYVYWIAGEIAPTEKDGDL